LPNRQCTIEKVGKSRSGHARYWCTEHQSNATGRYGARLPECEKAYLVVDEQESFDIDERDFAGGIGLWGATSPIYDTTPWSNESGIHVHARENPKDEKKCIDKTFPSVKIKYNKTLFDHKTSIITQEAAVYYYVSRYLKRKITHLYCIHCGHIHLDADYFSIHPHRRHLCNACGRYFIDDEKSVSNPIALLREQRNDTDGKRQKVRAQQALKISQEDYPGGLKLWASNPAILWTVPRPEHEGLHVHVYKSGSEERLKDDTFTKVIIDGKVINEQMARHLMAQQALQYLKNKIVSLECPKCGEEHFDDDEKGFYPHKDHICEHCGVEFQTPGKRRLVVRNPLSAMLNNLRLTAQSNKSR